LLPGEGKRKAADLMLSSSYVVGDAQERKKAQANFYSRRVPIGSKKIEKKKPP